jgi:hypothetical protein
MFQLYGWEGFQRTFHKNSTSQNHDQKGREVNGLRLGIIGGNLGMLGSHPGGRKGDGVQRRKATRAGVYEGR